MDIVFAESILSCSFFSFDLTKYCYPEVTTNNLKIKALFTGEKLVGDIEKMSSFWKTWNEQAEYGITSWQNLIMIIKGGAGALVPTATAIAGVAAAYALLDKAIFTSDEAIKKAATSAQIYETQKAKVESLNAELETTQNRIDELKAKGSLNGPDQKDNACEYCSMPELACQIAIIAFLILIILDNRTYYQAMKPHSSSWPSISGTRSIL